MSLDGHSDCGSEIPFFIMHKLSDFKCGEKVECCEREGRGAWYLFEMLQSQISLHSQLWLWNVQSVSVG